MSGFWIVAEKSNFVESSHWRGFGEIAERVDFLGIGLFGRFWGFCGGFWGSGAILGNEPKRYGVLEYQMDMAF